MTRSRQTADWGSRAGLAKIVPSSVAVGSGTGSANSLGTVTFTGVSSVSLNDVFNATYDNYKIILYSRTSSTSGLELKIRLRSSGTDNTNNWNSITDWSSSVTLGYGSNNSSLDNGIFAFGGNVLGLCEADVAVPFLALNTGIISKSVLQSNSDQYTATHGLYHSQATSYTGFTIYPSSGTFTGTISVYGYTN
jgi:hypothetical protein